MCKKNQTKHTVGRNKKKKKKECQQIIEIGNKMLNVEYWV